MNGKGKSGGLVLSLESGARISVHVLSVLTPALCLHLGIREGGRKRRATLKGLMIQGWKQVTTQKKQSSPTQGQNGANESSPNTAHLW